LGDVGKYRNFLKTDTGGHKEKGMERKRERREGRADK
jgi:hypothetical protein